MSAQPNRTLILVKDLLFQEKYHLSHTQTDLMAYMVNVAYWAIEVDGYFVISTSKVMSDLPAMNQKTFEASLKVLKDLELIETKIVEVKQWQGKPKLRGIRLTEKGKEYNSKLVLPSQDKEVKKLKQELKEKEEKIKEQEETIKRLSVSQTVEKSSNTPKKEPFVELTTTEFENFVLTVTKKFAITSQPICNGVPKWDKNTTFYINSYNKLSIITPEGEHKQLKNPKEINHFWQWLSKNPQRVGDKIDFSKSPTLKQLEKRLLNTTIKMGNRPETIESFVESKYGIKVNVKNQKGEVRVIIDKDTKKDKLFSLHEAQNILFKLLM